MPPLTRRQFLRHAATLAGGLVSARFLAACTAAPSPTPTEPATVASAPTETPRPTAQPTAEPTPTNPPVPTPPPAPEIIRYHPDAPSTVVRVRHSGAWSGETLVPEALRQMLDASITALTGLSDARAAWAALFRPNERIAIKVNAFQNSLVWTHPPLVAALTDSLQEAGIAAEQIVIYDNLTRELKRAGYAVNENGAGVRCYGSNMRHTAGWKVAGTPVELSDVLLSCDALINVPLLKVHGMTGISYALKNHYGTVSKPADLHVPKLNDKLAGLNALAEIKDRTRLIIGDALAICTQGADTWPYWRVATPSDTLLVSYDPVAVDTVGLRVFSEAVTAEGGSPQLAQAKTNAWLKAAANLGVGTNEMENIRQVDVALS